MTDALQRELREQLEGEVRFDPITRALYSTDASVYQIEPQGVVIPRTRADIVTGNVARMIAAQLASVVVGSPVDAPSSVAAGS